MDKTRTVSLPPNMCAQKQWFVNVPVSRKTTHIASYRSQTLIKSTVLQSPGSGRVHAMDSLLILEQVVFHHAASSLQPWAKESRL